MRKIYGMRRANGDWFALEIHGRLRMPLFKTSKDAMVSRLRNFGMMLFKPVALDAHLLNEILPKGGASEVDFCLIEDPHANLNRGSLLEHSQLVLQIPKSAEPAPGNGKTPHVSGVLTLPQSEWWN